MLQVLNIYSMSRKYFKMTKLDIYILWYKLFIINYRVLHCTSNFHNWNAILKNGRDIKRWSILKHVKFHFRSIMVKWHISLNDLLNSSTICLKICQMYHIKLDILSNAQTLNDHNLTIAYHCNVLQMVF